MHHNHLLHRTVDKCESESQLTPPLPKIQLSLAAHNLPGALGMGSPRQVSTLQPLDICESDSHCCAPIECNSVSNSELGWGPGHGIPWASHRTPLPSEAQASTWRSGGRTILNACRISRSARSRHGTSRALRQRTRKINSPK